MGKFLLTILAVMALSTVCYADYTDTPTGRRHTRSKDYLISGTIMTNSSAGRQTIDQDTYCSTGRDTLGLITFTYYLLPDLSLKAGYDRTLSKSFSSSPYENDSSRYSLGIAYQPMDLLDLRLEYRIGAGDGSVDSSTISSENQQWVLSFQYGTVR